MNREYISALLENEQEKLNSLRQKRDPATWDVRQNIIRYEGLLKEGETE